MIKRIKKLSEQCRKKFTCHECGESSFDYEKFAELLENEYTKDCRDMFIVGSVSWNLLNEKLEAIGDRE